VNLLSKKRGVSGIISGVFLVAVAVMVFNVLAWQFFQADAYNRIFHERQLREWERYNERLIILDVAVGTERLNFTVKNYGAVSAHVVDLFFGFSNGTHLYYALDVWIASGTTKRIASVGPKLLLSDVYDFKIGTERGNVFAPAQQSIYNQLQPTGQQSVPFTLTFVTDAFQFILYGETWNPPVKSAWYINNPAYKGKHIVFRVNITNTYPSDVVLLSGCNMLLVTPDIEASTMKIGYRMYISNEDTTITYEQGKYKVQPIPSQGQVIPAGKSRYVYFSQTAENNTFATQLDANGENRNYSNYVAIFYKIKNDASGTIFGATAAIIAMQIKTT